MLYDIDHNQSESMRGNTEQIHHLLYNLALLQYNNFWHASHPVIRTLPEYKRLSETK